MTAATPSWRPTRRLSRWAMSWVSTTREPAPSRDNTVSKTLRSSDWASSTMTNESCSERPRMCVNGGTSSMPRARTSSSTAGLASPSRGVEDGLRPGAHLVALAAGQVTELLAADGIPGTEDHDLALGAPLQHRLRPAHNARADLPVPAFTTEGDDPDRLVEQQVQRHPLFGGASAQTEHLPVTANQLQPLVGIDPPQRVRGAAQQPDPGDTADPGFSQVHLACGEERVDVPGGHVEFGHPGPAGGDHVLGVVLVGGQSDGTGLTRNGMSLLTRVTRLPSAARLAAQARIRASLVSVRNPAGSTVGRCG